MDLDLKDVAACQHCGYESYEEAIKDNICPRCHKAFADDEAEESGSDTGSADEDDEEESRPAPKGKKKKKGKKGKKGKAAPPPPPQNKKVVLDEKFKAAVFDALRRSDAGEAQQLCVDLVDGNEEHAKQIYAHLLEIARKKNWIGAGPAPTPVQVVPVQVVAISGPHAQQAQAEDGFKTMPVPADPGGALPIPAGLFGDALPLPPGIFPPGTPGAETQDFPAGGLETQDFPPGQLQPQDPTVHFPAPGGAAFQHAGPAPFHPNDPTVQLPPRAAAQAFAPNLPPPATRGPQPGRPGSGVHGVAPASSPHGVGPRPGSAVQPALPQTPRPAATRLTAPPASVPSASAPPATAAAPPPPPVEKDPEERGFLGRVAVEGRAAQVQLLCLAGHHAAAKELAQSTLVRDPYSARAHAALGDALCGLGQEPQALQSYQNAVRADPNDPAIVRGYAQVLTRLGRHTDAIAAYRRIVGPGKGEARDVVALATALRRVGDVAGAQRVHEELLRRDPQSLEPVRQQAEALLGANDIEGAAGALERILGKEAAPFPIATALAESLAPRAAGSPRATLACARTWLVAGRPLAAVRLLLPLVARDPQQPEPHRWLGLAYSRLGAHELAEEQLVPLVARGAATADELLALGEGYLERGDFGRGIQALGQAAKARPEDGAVRRALARALAAQGDLEGALRELKSAAEGQDHAALEEELDRVTERAFVQRLRRLEARLQVAPDDAQARLDLADALAQRGDVAEALTHVERAAKAPDSLEAAVALCERLREEKDARRPATLLAGRLLEEGGQAERALALLEEHLSQSPDDAEVRLLLYRCASSCGRMQDAVVGLRGLLADASPPLLDEAARLAERLLEQEGYQGLAPSAARARRRLGHLDRAAALFERHLEAEPEDLEARRELAQLLEASGKHDKAYDVLRVVLQDGATSAELERLAQLALAAGKVDAAVEQLRQAASRAPDDLVLKGLLEGAEARAREPQLAALEKSTKDEDRLRLAGLLVEAGKLDQAREVLRALGRLGEHPELALLRFSAEHLARAGKTQKAEAALRALGRALSYAPGSEQHKALLGRVAGLYEHTGERRAARRVLLELHALAPGAQDVEARLEALSDDGAGPAGAAIDQRVVELIDVGAPLGTIFDALQTADLSLDARRLETFRGAAPE